VVAQPGSVSGQVDYYLTRYDLSGNGLVHKLLFSLVSDQLINPQVYVSPPIEGKEFLYVVATNNTQANGLSVQIEKFDIDGTFKWSTTRTAANGVVPLRAATDASGNFYLALTEYGFTVGFESLELLEYGGSGAVVHDFTVTDIEFPTTTFTQGKWVACGITDVSSFTPKMAIYDSATGSETGHVNFDSVDNGTYTYGYNLNSYVHPNGTIYLGVTVNKYDDAKGGAPVLINHFLRSYSLAGVQKWTSASYAGGVVFLSGSGASSCPLWLVGSPNPEASTANFFLEKYDTNGVRAFQKPGYNSSSAFIPVEDSVQTFLLRNDAAHPRTLLINQFDQAGNAGTTLSSTTTAGASNAVSKFGSTYLRNGSLYACEYLPNGSQVVFQRFVTGVTLSALSSTGSVKGGGAIPLKVMLNSPAPSGGILVKLASNNAKLLFPNNSTVYTLAIPVGSIYTNVSLHSSSVAANTAVTITGNQNGVVRQAVITVQH
jgi:hypothetical protein